MYLNIGQPIARGIPASRLTPDAAAVSLKLSIHLIHLSLSLPKNQCSVSKMASVSDAAKPAAQGSRPLRPP